MRKLALIVGAFGLLSFAGIARADQKTESSEKTDTTTTLGGKVKTTRTKKVERADGSGMETKVETTRPKAADRDAVEPAKRDDADAQVKSEEKTTLTGKKEHKTVRKYDAPDGTHTESTTTTTDPDKK